jgi:hypothetical protein
MGSFRTGARPSRPEAIEWPVDADTVWEELIAAYLRGEINTVHVDETGVSILPEPHDNSPLYDAVRRARATNRQVPH